MLNAIEIQTALHQSQQRIEELERAAREMHKGLIIMQSRLDDHEKVLEKMITAMDNLAHTAVPNGFRQPSTKQ